MEGNCTLQDVPAPSVQVVHPALIIYAVSKIHNECVLLIIIIVVYTNLASRIEVRTVIMNITIKIIIIYFVLTMQ